MTTFDPRKHPRWPKGDPRGGRFRPKSETQPPTPAPKRTRTKPTPTPVDEIDKEWHRARRRLRRASDSDLSDLFSWAVRLAYTDEARASRILDELEVEERRRKATAEPTAEERRRSRRVDQLVSTGWDYVEAWADVHGQDPETMRREERMAEVRRRQRAHGGRAEKIMREMWAEETAVRWLAAHEACNGHLLNTAGRAAATRGRRVDGLSLFGGPAATARKYASDELKQWWEQHGGRRPYAQWRAELVGDKRTAEAHRLAGSGRDYGV